MSVRHFLDIDGAATLPTEQLSLVDQAVADLVATRAMGAVHGQAGLGKTFAVEAALARRTRQVSPCWASFPSRPTMRLVAATLLGELSAEPAPGRRDRFALSAELLEQLADHRGRDGRRRGRKWQRCHLSSPHGEPHCSLPKLYTPVRIAHPRWPLGDVRAFEAGN